VFDRANGIRREFLASPGETVLLHGDLHHDNVLRAAREPWLVIDPKGVAGEREFEVGPLMYNPWQRLLEWPNLKAILSRRVDILVEVLGFDRQRLLGWALVGAVLSMLWSIEDHAPDWDAIMPVAQAFDELIFG
jgi:streptomycin 6-kinase